MYTVNSIIVQLQELRDPTRVAGMNKAGIQPRCALGIQIPVLRSLAKKICPGSTKNSELGFKLWKTGIHEARILSSMLLDPGTLTSQEMDGLVEGFDSWDLCDQTCNNLLRHSPLCWDKVAQWAAQEPEFTRRAGFALLASMIVHYKNEPDQRLADLCLPLVRAHATDDRNMVKKAVNWSLRNLGKRSLTLHPLALELAQELQQADNATARWIGNDAVRELQSKAVRKRLGLDSRA